MGRRSSVEGYGRTRSLLMVLNAVGKKCLTWSNLLLRKPEESALGWPSGDAVQTLRGHGGT